MIIYSVEFASTVGTIKQAIKDATTVVDSGECTELPITPANYDGDAEAFMFSWSELSQLYPNLDRDEAKSVYLAAFWAQIEIAQKQ